MDQPGKKSVNMTTEHKILIGGGLGTILIIAGGIFLTSTQDSKRQEQLKRPFIGQKITDMGQTHIPRSESFGEYNSNPPTSGPHWGDGVAGAGIHDKEVPDELLVHSLEHGAAILWYKADLPKDQVEKLKTIFNDASGKKIMLSRKNLDTPAALTSWNYLLKLKTIDAKQIKKFIENNSNRAPEQAPI